jgi:hypothetical protein
VLGDTEGMGDEGEMARGDKSGRGGEGLCGEDDDELET